MVDEDSANDEFDELCDLVRDTCVSVALDKDGGLLSGAMLHATVEMHMLAFDISQRDAIDLMVKTLQDWKGDLGPDLH